MQPNFDPLGLGGFAANGMPQMAPPPNGQSKKKGFQWSSLISEGAGTGGALGGAAAGAAIGSVVPGLGTAIGGLVGAGLGGFLGGTGGKLVEDQVQGNQTNLGGALKEGAIEGVMGAGPLRLARLGLSGAKVARGAAPSLEAALTTISEPLKTSARGRLKDWGNKALASQYGTISKPVARQTDPMNTVSKLADIGVVKPQDAERIAGAVTGSDGLINRAVLQAVGGAQPVKLDNLQTVVQKALNETGLVDSQAKSLKSIVDAQLKKVDPKQPGSILQMMKNLEEQAAEYMGQGGTAHLATSLDKRRAKALGMIRDELQESLYKTAGANKNLANVMTPQLREELLSLNPKSPQWQSFVDDKVMKAGSVKELRSTMAPFVRVNKMIVEGDINAFTAGGRLGNSIAGNNLGGTTGMLANVATNTIKNPASRAAGQGLRKASEAGTGPLTSPGALGITGRMGLTAGATAGMGVARGTMPAAAMNMESVEDPTLEGAFFGNPAQQYGATGGFDPLGTGGANGYNMTPHLENGTSGPLDPVTKQPIAQTSPYSRDNLLADIQRDPANAQKYIEYYQQLEEIFAPAGDSMQDLSQSSRNALASSDNAINTIDQLEGMFGSAGGASGRLGGGIKNLAGKAGFAEEAKVYNDMAEASVTQIAKALAGSGAGTVSDMDAKVIISALPRFNDSPAEAQAKFAALRQRLEAARNNTLLYGGGTSQPATIEDTLTQGALY